MSTLETLKNQLLDILQKSIELSQAEKSYLIDNIDLFNEEELEELIKKNQEN